MLATITALQKKDGVSEGSPLGPAFVDWLRRLSRVNLARRWKQLVLPSSSLSPPGRALIVWAMDSAQLGKEAVKRVRKRLWRLLHLHEDQHQEESS